MFDVLCFSKKKKKLMFCLQVYIKNKVYDQNRKSEKHVKGLVKVKVFTLVVAFGPLAIVGQCAYILSLTFRLILSSSWLKGPHIRFLFGLTLNQI